MSDTPIHDALAVETFTRQIDGPRDAIGWLPPTDPDGPYGPGPLDLEEWEQR